MKRHGKTWTPGEDAILRAEIGTISRARIALRLGRSEEGVRGRAIRLGLIEPKARMAKPEHRPPATIEQVHAIAAEVQRRREQYAARIAGCPLERWLEVRTGGVRTGLGRGRGGACCGCRCHGMREAA